MQFSRLFPNLKLDLDPKFEEIATFINLWYNFSDRFRLEYTLDHIRYMCADIRVACRDADGHMIAFSGARQMELSFRDARYPVAECNLLCIIPKYQGQKLTKELVNIVEARSKPFARDIFCVSSMNPSKPLGTHRYFHRPINLKPLIHTGFTEVGKKYSKFKDPVTTRQRILDTFPKCEDLKPFTLTKRSMNELLTVLNVGRPKELHQVFTRRCLKELPMIWLTFESTVVGLFQINQVLDPVIIRTVLVYTYRLGGMTFDTLVHELLGYCRREEYDLLNIIEPDSSWDFLSQFSFERGTGVIGYHMRPGNIGLESEQIKYRIP